MKFLVFSGCLAALIGVGLGAFGAHALKGRLDPEMLAIWQTAVLYHLVHALGMVLAGILAHLFPDAAGVRWGGWLLLAGIVLFSGSLYLLAGYGQRWLGAITPFGGISFLVGWGMLAFSALRRF